MKLDKKKQVCFIFIFLCVLFLGGVQYFFLSSQKESLENKTNLQIVIARYNEDLEWLKEYPFNEYPIIVYNKGPNDNYYHAPNIIQHNKIKNVGRCDHTYLYHIIENYNNLADVTVFLPGSVNMSIKILKAKYQVLECAKHNNTVFFLNQPYLNSYHKNGVKQDYEYFQVDDYVSSNKQNQQLNTEEKMLHATIRPFGKWYDAHFPNIHITIVNYGGIMGIGKKHIIQHPKAYYEKLIQELNTHSNPEAGHYFERSWAAVFYPNEDAIIR
jgi:hypothetical protein